MVLIVLSAAWLIGLYIGSMLELPPLLLFLGVVPLPLLFIRRLDRKKIIVVGLAIFLLMGAGLYSHSSLYQSGETRMCFYNDLGPADIKAMVAADPDVRDKSARLTLDVSAVYLDNEWRDIEGKALALVPRYPAYKYGDILRIRGEPQTPPRLDDFDYRGYLEHQGIYTIIYFPRIEVLESGRGFPPLTWIYNLRADMARTLAEVLPEPQASLAQGILLGLRGNIPADLNDDFARSGTSHLLAISGFNLAIMAGILLAVGLWLFGRRHYLYVWLAVGIIWFYTVITGMNPPVVRGAVMASVFLSAEALGRQRSAVAALVFAAAVMAGVSPYILGDASFQLSFMAMVGLIFIYPVFSNYGKQLVSNKLGDDGFIVSVCNLTVDTMSATLGAVIAVWPVIAYYFGMFSVVGPLATFLLIPVQPFILVIGIFAALFGLVSGLIAQVFGWLLWPFLTYMVLLVRGFGSPAVSSVAVDWISPGVIIGYYLLLAALIWVYGRRRKLRNMLSGAAGVMKAGVDFTFGLARGARWLIVPLLLLAALATFTAVTLPGDELRVSFLDVGEGDAILVQKGNTQLLIDGGPSPQAITLALSRQMPFWDRSIEAVVLTHPHQDHLAGLVEVLKRYKVETVVYAPLVYSSPTYEEWLNLIDINVIAGVPARNGLQLTMGENTLIKFLSPPSALLAGTQSDIDNNSVVVLLQEGGVKFLLTGYIMRDAEWELVRNRADLSCTVMKAPHHGSDTSGTLEFLAVASPQIAVISCGADNKFGHPDAEIIDRLEERIGEENIYRTDIHGTIEFTTDGERLWVKTER